MSDSCNTQVSGSPQHAGRSAPAWGWRTALGVGAVVLLLAVQGVLAVTSLVTKSVTIDESAHLPAGCTYWLKGTFGLYHHNPPLVRLWAAAPVLVAGADVDFASHWNPPTRRDRWVFATDFMFANLRRYRHLFNVGRVAMVVLMLVGGYLVFRWAARLFGTASGLTALALWTLSPTVLAHGRLITTDVGGTVAMLLAVYALWRYCRRPGWGRAVVAGLALGGAALCKFSALSLYPVFLLLVVCDHVLRRGTRAPIGIARKLGHLAVSYLVSVVVINAGYVGEGTFTPLGDYDFLSKPLAREVAPTLPPEYTRQARSLTAGEWQKVLGRESVFRDTWLAAVPVPLPFHFVAGYDRQKLEAEQGYWMFLDGRTSHTGWRHYYLLAFAYKVPVSTIALLVVAVVFTALCVRGRDQWADQLFLLVPVAVTMAAMSLLTNICIGVRYVLPMFPFLFVWVSQLVGRSPVRWRRVVPGVVVLAALGWNVREVAIIHPHYLAYFNQIAGGPGEGYRRLHDSNIDWGQDLPLVEQYVHDHPGESIGLAYFGAEWPGLFGLRYTVPPFLEPKPGTYAVSANFLQGRPWSVRDQNNRRVPVPADAYRYFLRLDPVAKLGYSIFVYRLAESDIVRARVDHHRHDHADRAARVHHAETPVVHLLDPGGKVRP